jgi:hypothetical protein
MFVKPYHQQPKFVELLMGRSKTMSGKNVLSPGGAFFRYATNLQGAWWQMRAA